MFELFTIALFQIATVFGYAPADQASSTEPTPPKTEKSGTVGSGGWGNDAACSTVGSGGWGND
ncbi:MAG TPA: hypothetical protein VF629_02950 [Hymenobacter sp.]|jgi:hypothetical protein|uniref:hypothetical protein n=1 Tax=Hymenobacter sp. TaxID=1898978 RepID=UPI002ED8F8A8